MFNGRLYRAAFLPFGLALAVAALSLGSRPLPLRSNFAPDAFEGQRALAALDGLAAAFPQRRPGSTGDERLAEHVAGALRALGGFSVHIRHSESQTIAGERGLTTVIAVRPGSTSATPILILAHRDAASVGSKAELSGTAALLELARVFAARETKRTIVVVSTSGGSGGDGGAAQLTGNLAELGQHGPFDAAIVLGDVAGRRAERPFVVPYSDGFGSAPLQLQRTLSDAIEHEAGTNPGAPSPLGQLAHLAFPLATGEQGVLDAQGVPAVLVQVSSERGPRPDSAVDGSRLEGIGRGVLSAIDALDTAPDIAQAKQAGILIQHKLMPEWALRLLAGTLLLPPLVAGADGLARVRRRRRPVGRWTIWTLSWALPLLCCALFCFLLGHVGIIDAAPSVPVPQGALPFDGGAAIVVAAAALILLLGGLLRGSLVRRAGLEDRPDPEVAGLPIVLVLLVLAAIVWLSNPYAALLAIPAIHLWLVLASPELRPRRPAALALVALALVPLGLLIAFYARQQGMGLGGLAWGAVLLLAGGHISLPGTILWSVALGCGLAATMLAARSPFQPPERHERDDVEVTIRGPMSYAGPGSLGGTESGLRR
jgi:hypothetical protein